MIRKFALLGAAALFALAPAAPLSAHESAISDPQITKPTP